jgi:hypothetical protein
VIGAGLDALAFMAALVLLRHPRRPPPRMACRELAKAPPANEEAIPAAKQGLPLLAPL